MERSWFEVPALINDLFFILSQWAKNKNKFKKAAEVHIISAVTVWVRQLWSVSVGFSEENRCFGL